MIRLAFLLSSALLPGAFPADEAKAPADSAAKVHKIAVGGEGGWDYLTVDPDAKRLYVSRGNRVVVIDTESEKVIGEVTGTPGVSGIAVVPELGKGFTSNGGDSSVTVFDLKTLKATGKIKARGRPDAILYDPASKRVITFNHSTNDGTSIDPAAEKVVGTIDFAGEPEAAVADGKGHIFVNVRSTSEILEFDALSLKTLNRWPLAPGGQRPNGLAIDKKNRRLFSGCNANSKMVIMDADKGTVIAAVDIGKGSDGCGFDPEKGLAYSSNGDGTLTVIGETEPGKFGVVATVPTQASARTMTLDPKTHRVYLSAASFAPRPADAPKAEPAKTEPTKGDQPKTKGFGRPPLVPGSFVIVVVGD